MISHKLSATANRAAFTLAELLTVMAIIGLLLSASGPVFQSFGSAHGVSQGIYEISGLLDYARSEAVTRQTYVRVGFRSDKQGGTPVLLMAAVYSKDGSGTNVDPTNLQSLSKVLRVTNAELINWDELQPQTQSLCDSSPSSVAGNENGVSFQVGETAFANKSITFTPRGEALLNGVVLPDDGFDASMAVGFRQVHGSAVPNDAAVIVSGATGVVKSIRLP